MFVPCTVAAVAGAGSSIMADEQGLEFADIDATVAKLEADDPHGMAEARRWAARAFWVRMWTARGAPASY